MIALGEPFLAGTSDRPQALSMVSACGLTIRDRTVRFPLKGLVDSYLPEYSERSPPSICWHDSMLFRT